MRLLQDFWYILLIRLLLRFAILETDPNEVASENFWYYGIYPYEKMGNLDAPEIAGEISVQKI